MGGTNYIRNSVKVVVDAYNGDVNFYVVDENDPMAKTYQKIYPQLFKSVDKMPDSLKAHIRYPNTLFEIQAGVYSRYHMEDVKVFYQNEDVWDIANEIYGKDEKEWIRTTISLSFQAKTTLSLLTPSLTRQNRSRT